MGTDIINEVGTSNNLGALLFNLFLIQFNALII